MSESVHGMWSSRLMFILAVAGSAVGLGNIWRFPYVAGENGGGVFVLAYIGCIALIGIPIMIAEIVLGRAGRQSPINTMRTLTARSEGSSAWQAIGWMGALAGFMILSFYSVIAGWALAYLIDMGRGVFVDAGAEFATSSFQSFTGDPVKVLGWHTLFMIITTIIAARGVGKGLETTVRYLMPTLFFLLLALVAWAAFSSGHFQEGLAFLFAFKTDQFTGDSILMAMGQAFFTLSLGMGAIMAYGAYLPKEASIVNSALTIAVIDTLVAICSGLVIFPIVFANGLEPSAGPGLMFISLPIAFGQMAGGQFFGTLFFLLVGFAAITSAISIGEPAVAWVVEKAKVTRKTSAIVIGSLAWLVGIGSALSFNLWSDVKLLPGKTFFDTMDYVSNNIILPLGGILIGLFAGWVLDRKILAEQLSDAPSLVVSCLLWLIRVLAPLGIAVVFIMTIIN
ncbi:MAG: sodium-dependent transporter [Pseudomonadales bacterium]|nr:sodium-dependent transporter [Pseudomonadales bacterium]MBO6703065.1 sodium-dependent transporter [Pseudomonadales bacterium]MBO7006276.1 sodium-dependent transporter [Pseudomonadales bacterium]